MATTLLNIKTAVASYLGHVVADLTVDGQDLFLLAANQARKFAELNNDFEFSRKLVTVSVNGATGGNLATAVEGEDTIEIKTVLEVGLLDTNNNLIPAEWTTVGESLERQRINFGSGVPRYPTDAYARDRFSSSTFGSRFTFSGDSVACWPKTDENANLTYLLYLEVYSFYPDWDDLDTSDIWTKHGQQYLQWATIVQLNNLFKEFVFRQEGNLPPPQELADKGLAALVEWDAYRFEGFRRHQR